MMRSDDLARCDAANVPALTSARKAVLIVDCAIRSGLTMKAVIGAVRKLNSETDHRGSTGDI